MISLKNQIKSLLAVLVVSLSAFAGVAAVLFQKNFDSFTDFIGEKSKSHLEVLSSLAEIETGLYLHQQSFACAISSGSDKCLITLRETEQVVADQFKFLENFNKSRFTDWVHASDFAPADSHGELRGLIAAYQAAPPNGQSRDDSWQRLYALVRADSENYFEATRLRLKQHFEGNGAESGTVAADLSLEQKTLDLLFLGVAEIRERYNATFWLATQTRDAAFTRDTANYYRALVIGSALLIFLAGLIALLIHRHFRIQEAHEENLVRLGTRDLATGLFNRKSMESMLTQEIERAKRRNYALSVVILRVEPFEKLRVELGQVAVDRLFFQVAEVLRASCRSYDGIFKSDSHSFVVILPEAHQRFINELCGRFLGRIGKKRFLVKSDQTKVAPTILAGAAAYPLNGANAEDLLKFAEMTLSAKFDARILEKNVGAMAGPAPVPQNELPASDAAPAEPAEPDAPEAPFSAASVIAKLKARAVKTDGVQEAGETAPEHAEPDPASSNVIPLAKTEEPADIADAETEPTAPVPEETAPAQQDPPDIAPSTDTPPVAEVKALQPPPADEDAVSADEIPDVVNALLQGESEPAADEAPVKPLSDEPAEEELPPDTLTPGTHKPQDIQIVKTDKEDVIMVDFDRDRADLAERFRRKRGQKPAAN